MIIREMTFDDIAEVAELERLYSRTPWDATGLFSWWLRDDTIFLVAGEELPEEQPAGEGPSAAAEDQPAGEASERNGDKAAGSEASERNGDKPAETMSGESSLAGNLPGEAGEALKEHSAEALEESGEDYVPPVVYGYAGLLLIPYESDITNITVSGECRRQGVATKLLEELFRRAPEKGVTLIHLEVRESNEPARALYRKLGFAEDGRRKNYYADPKEDAILMTKDLGKET